MALDDLAEYFDAYPEMGGGIIKHFTADNLSIADVTGFPKTAFFLEDFLDPQPGSGRKIAINLYKKAVLALIEHFSRNWIAAVFGTLKIALNQKNLKGIIRLLTGKSASIRFCHFRPVSNYY